MMKDENGEEKLTVDFNKQLPMPESLKVTCGSSNKYDIYTYLSNKGEKTVAQILTENNEKDLKEMLGFSFSSVTEMLNQMASEFLDMAKDDISKSYDAGKQLVNNYTEHGATTWFDWRCQNWGTKWNACNTEITDKGDDVVLRFNTAWDPPIGVLGELSKHIDFVDIARGEEGELDILEGKNGKFQRIPECTYQLQGTYKVSIIAEDGLDLEQLKDIFDKMEDEDFKISLFVGIENKEDVIVQVLTKKDEYKALWAVETVRDELERKIESALEENDLDYSTVEVEAEGDYIVRSLTPNHAYPEETGAFHFRKGTFEITASSELIFSKEDYDKLTFEQKASFDRVTDRGTSVFVKMKKTDIYREFEQQVAEQIALWNVKSMMPGLPYEILDRTIQNDAIDKVITTEPPIMQKEETPKRDRANADLNRD